MTGGLGLEGWDEAPRLSRLIHAAVAPALLAVTFARQRFLDALLLAGLQVKRVPLDFLDNVLLQHFSFEAPERAL